MPEYDVVIADGGLARRFALASDATERLSVEAVEDIAREIAETAKTLAPRRTGNLVRNISSTSARRGPDGYIEARAGVGRGAPYARFVEEGTGIFGPYRRPIVPKTGNFMTFKLPDGKTVYARSIRGQEAKRYFERATQLVKTNFVEARLQGLARSIGNVVQRG